MNASYLRSLILSKDFSLQTAAAVSLGYAAVQVALEGRDQRPNIHERDLAANIFAKRQDLIDSLNQPEFTKVALMFGIVARLVAWDHRVDYIAPSDDDFVKAMRIIVKRDNAAVWSLMETLKTIPEVSLFYYDDLFSDKPIELTALPSLECRSAQVHADIGALSKGEQPDALRDEFGLHGEQPWWLNPWYGEAVKSSLSASKPEPNLAAADEAETSDGFAHPDLFDLLPQFTDEERLEQDSRLGAFDPRLNKGRGGAPQKPRL
jgi:hypothetical protein